MAILTGPNMMPPAQVSLRQPKTSLFCDESLLSVLQGNTIVVGRKSPHSLYNEKIASFEDDEGLYDQKDAAGFIKLQVATEYVSYSCAIGKLHLVRVSCCLDKLRWLLMLLGPNKLQACSVDSRLY